MKTHVINLKAHKGYYPAIIKNGKIFPVHASFLQGISGSVVFKHLDSKALNACNCFTHAHSAYHAAQRAADARGAKPVVLDNTA